MESGVFDASTLPRVAQLVGKTNQFNLTTRRYDLAQLMQFESTKAAWTQWFRLQDRFGDYGIVGVLIALPVLDDPDLWHIDTWLISCRALGRGLENAMFRCLLAAARKRGIKRLGGVFIPTEKNSQVADLYSRLGFIPSMRAGVETFVRDISSDDTE